MDEVLRPREEVLSALAAQMGLPVVEPAPPRPTPAPDKKPASAPFQKSYSQLT